MSANTNHIRYRLFTNCLLFAFLVPLTTTRAVAYNVYYGQLHGHSTDSHGTGYGGISSYTWGANPDDSVEFSNPNIEDPTVTITKATDNPSAVTLTLAGNGTFTDTMTIDVYDDACLAAVGTGLAAEDPADLDGNCVINFDDFALMAAIWLSDTGLTEPVPK